MYSIQLENLLIKTKTLLKLLGAGLNGLIIFNTQQVKGHDAGFVYISWAGT
jgi:hypothetical protein